MGTTASSSEYSANPLPPLSSLTGSTGNNGHNSNSNAERLAILSRIKPRSATPTQSSAISRSVVNAADTKSSRGVPSSELDDSILNGRKSAGRLSMLLKTPLTSTRRESLVNKEEADVGRNTSVLFSHHSSSKPEESVEFTSKDINYTDSQVKPLSSFLSPDGESSKSSILSNERLSEIAMNRFISRLAPEMSQNNDDQALESRKREEELPLTSIQTAPTKSDSLYRYKSSITAPTALSTIPTGLTATTAATTSSFIANRQFIINNPQLAPPPKTTTSSGGETAMNGLIRTLVEKNVAEAMSELRNDIHNLHVELIKQSLAQQTMLKQLAANVPESYRRIADENQGLREELERLKVSKGRF